MTTTASHAPSYAPRDDRVFAPLRLGPVTKARIIDDSLAPPPQYLPAIHTAIPTPTAADVKYPRIIVRDSLGRTLDTFTALQEAIYRASWMRKKWGEWPKTPMEWRLPKAPTPSKPDYSRAGPGVMTSYQFDGQSQRRNLATYRSCDASSNTRRVDLTADILVNLPTLEIPVDDVAFVAESLNHLPNLPSFSFLRHSILAGEATYVQIVASILLHQRQLRAKDQREALWTFPGFCSGCRRAGFCYGCSKNQKPHVHEDIPSMTGGGFRFWKRDRPHDPQSWKNPSNWKVPSTDEELRTIIEKYGDLSAYERARLRANQRAEHDVIPEETSHDLGDRYQRLRNLGTYPPYVTIVSTDDYVKMQLEDVADAGLQSEKEMLEDEERQRRRRTREEMRRKRKMGVVNYDEEVTQEREVTLASEVSSDRMLVRFDTRYDDALTDGRTREGRGTDDEEEDEGIVTERSRSRHKSHAAIIKSSRDRSESSHSQGQRSPIRTQKTSRLGFVDKMKEEEAEELARILRERAKENVPFGKKRRDVNYTAPKFFTVQKNSRKITVAKDPFSSDRDLDLPKGPTFQLKKSEKKTTKFIEFKKSDRGWKAPKMFEVKHEQKSTKFKTRSTSRSDSQGRRGRPVEDIDIDDLRRGRRKDVSSDSGIGSGITGDKDTVDDIGSDQAGDDVTLNAEDDKLIGGKGEGQQSATGQEGVDTSGTTVEEVQAKPKRREVVKKSRVERSLILTPPQSPPRLPSPPPFKRRSPTPPSPPPPRSPAPEIEEPPLPEIEIPEVPDLPEITEKAPIERKKQKLKFVVEPPPQAQVKEIPKRRKTAPKIRLVPRNLSRPRKSRPAEAPITAEDLNDIQDPLDFLAKYCIINPDRLPFYEVVFEATIIEQVPRYTKPAPWVQAEKPQPAESEATVEVVEEKTPVKEKVETKKKGKSKKTKSEAVKKETPALNPSLLPTEHGMNLEKVAMTLEEQHLEKLIYTLDMLQDKMTTLGGQLEQLEAKRTELIAQKARQRFPEITSPNYLSKKKKKGKKGNKKNKNISEETPRKFHSEEITDDIIVSRLEDKVLNEICREPDMKMLESEIEIRKLKARDIQNRVERIASEKLLADAFCMNHYFLRQGASNNLPEHFRRQQSELYNRLRPNPDFEMNLEEVEEALQQINNHLLTDKEFYFLYNVLNLPGRERINFRLFTIIAALSEKVTQLDPVIRKLINNFNYNALDIKMEKCKELFELLESEHMPKGAAQAASLAVELTAGGLRPEHTRYVLNKFNRDSKGIIDFLDFVTYVPLFVEIHKRIINNPLSEKFDL